MEAEFDVGIIGGGPAGSTAASYLAKAGLKVALFEAENMPREHVGEARGRRTVLGRQLKVKESDPVFTQYAIHTWFDGLDRTALTPSAAQADYIFVHFLPLTDTWVWQIPITDTVTSVGVVTQKKRFASWAPDRGGFFWDCVGSRPDLCKALREAKQVRPFKTEGDYSYSMKEVCGDGFVLLGDA